MTNRFRENPFDLKAQYSKKSSGATDPTLINQSLESTRSLLEQIGNIAVNRQSSRQAQARWQDAVIEREIKPRASVLDLGCGDGDLLERLARTKKVMGQGMEVEPQAVYACVERGVPVFQADLDEGLHGFPDKSFDFVILEETLQTVHRPVEVVREMLRVGRRGIISFPNFGYWRVRLDLTREGRMPVTEALPYRWYESPNIHLFSIRDFLAWTAKENLRIVKAFALVEGVVRKLGQEDNLFAEEALMIVKSANNLRTE